MAYFVLCETERHNIINVIESVRYSLEPKAISDMLIIS